MHFINPLAARVYGDVGNTQFSWPVTRRGATKPAIRVMTKVTGRRVTRAASQIRLDPPRRLTALFGATRYSPRSDRPGRKTYRRRLPVVKIARNLLTAGVTTRT